MKPLKIIGIIVVTLLTCSFTANADTVYVKNIEVEETRIYVERYEEERIYYTVLPENASDKGVRFQSMDESIVTVDDDGFIYGRHTGNTKIMMQSNDKKVTRYVNVTVTDDYLYNDESIQVWKVSICENDEAIKDSIQLMRTQQKQLIAKIYPEIATDKRIRWKSSDNSVATIDENGNIKAVREGTVKISAISRSSGKQDNITLTVVPFVKYPERISIIPQNTVFETGKKIKFNAEFFPENTTEKKLYWNLSGNIGSIDQSGSLEITDSGKGTVTVYSADRKQSASYEFTAKYSDNHFEYIGESFNVKADRNMVFTFDNAVNSLSAQDNVFCTADRFGNGEKIAVNVTAVNNTLNISPENTWVKGENYLFIKDKLSDIDGNKLGRNICYKINAQRGFEE